MRIIIPVVLDQRSWHIQSRKHHNRDNKVYNGVIVDPGGPGTPIPVAGFWVPINKFQLLAPWITLVSLMAATTLSIGYITHRKKHQN
jgi:hypothetical protein